MRNGRVQEGNRGTAFTTGKRKGKRKGGRAFSKREGERIADDGTNASSISSNSMVF